MIQIVLLCIVVVNFCIFMWKYTLEPARQTQIIIIPQKAQQQITIQSTFFFLLDIETLSDDIGAKN